MSHKDSVRNQEDVQGVGQGYQDVPLDMERAKSHLSAMLSRANMPRVGALIQIAQACGHKLILESDTDRNAIDHEQVTRMSMIDLTPRQLELLRRNGLSTRLHPDKSFHEWQCAWDFLWSALYHGWLDDDIEGKHAAEDLLRAMAQARADDSAGERGLDAGEAVLLAPLQERLLASLHLRAVIYTGMPDDEWNEIREGLLAAQRAVDHDYLYEDTYSYIQLCLDTVRSMDEAKRYAEEGETARIIDHLLQHKRKVAYALVTKHDPKGFRPGEPDGDDIDAYIWESGVIGTFVLKRASVEQASEVIAYVLNRSFGDCLESFEVEDLARDLLRWLPDDLMDPEDFPSFEDDLKPLIDGQFEAFEERMPWAIENLRERAMEEGRDLDCYSYLYNVHFLTTFMSDYSVKKHYTGEVHEPFFELVAEGE